MMRKIFKKIVHNLLAQVGISIKRIKAQSNSDPIYESLEWLSLSADLNAFFKKPRSGFSWDSAQSVLHYLSPTRIRQYHSLTDACDLLKIPIKECKVADVGPGVGYFLRHLNSRYNPQELWGFDMKDDDLEIAAHLCPAARLEKKSFQSLPRNRFDLVFLMQVIEHVTHPVDVVKDILNCLPPGGRLVITIPDGRADQLMAGEYYPGMNSYWGHINFWSIESWEIFLTQNFAEMAPITGVLPVETKNLFAILQTPPTSQVL